MLFTAHRETSPYRLTTRFNEIIFNKDGKIKVNPLIKEKNVLKKLGMELIFWKIAMRPGKPLIFGKLNKTLGGVAEAIKQTNKLTAGQTKILQNLDPGSRRLKGDTYDATRDAFIEPHEFPSWVFNESTCMWNPPSSMPDDGKLYKWNETETRWDEVILPT